MKFCITWSGESPTAAEALGKMSEVVQNKGLGSNLLGILASVEPKTEMFQQYLSMQCESLWSAAGRQGMFMSLMDQAGYNFQTEFLVNGRPFSAVALELEGAVEKAIQDLKATRSLLPLRDKRIANVRRELEKIRSELFGEEP